MTLLSSDFAGVAVEIDCIVWVGLAVGFVDAVVGVGNGEVELEIGVWLGVEVGEGLEISS